VDVKDDENRSTVDLEDDINTSERSTTTRKEWRLLQQCPKPIKVKAKGKDAARTL
jgi:hypothetical protein